MKRTSNMRKRQGWGRKPLSVLLAVLLAVMQVQVSQAAIVNTVVATGQVGAQTLSSNGSATVTVVTAAPAITLAKVGTVNDGGDGTADPGDTISYQFAVTNTGNVTLSSVTVSDPLVTVSGGPLATLVPGASDTTTFTATYTLTATDVANGSVANTATVTATPLSGGSVTAQGSANTSLTLLQSMTLTKTGTLNDGGDGRADAGDTISYQFVVTNTGNTTLTNVSVSDPKLNFSALNLPGASQFAGLGAADPMATGTLGPALRPGLSEEGEIAQVLQSVATRTTDLLHSPRSLPELREAFGVDRHVLRTSGAGGAVQAGEQLALVYVATNMGEAPLTGVQARSARFAAYGDDIPVLVPGTSDRNSLIFTYEVSEADLARGVIRDDTVIAAHGRNRTLLSAGGPDINLAAIDGGGDLLTATITPSNVPSLNPGQQATFTASYTLTQADVDAGVVNNSATATATGSGGVTLTAVASASVTLVPQPGIAVVKTASLDLGADSTATPGDIITYSFAVTNTGNVTLSNVTLVDPLVSVSGGPIVALAPGQTDATTFTASYALTLADVNAGQVTNQATATGTSPAGPTVSDLSDDALITQDDPTVTPLAPNAQIALVKTAGTIADTNGSGATDAGDTITYSFTVTNTGNVTLTNISISDPLVPVNGGPLASLAPGASDSASFSASYVLTQADVDAGQVVNQANVTGTAPDSSTVSDLSDDAVTSQNDPTVTSVGQAPGIAIIKTVSSISDSNGDSLTDAGDVINYTFTVTNTGTLTLSNVSVTDPLVTVSGGPLASLLPGATDSTTFTAAYTITAGDMAAGQVTNQATASATAPGGAPISDLSDNDKNTEDQPTVTAVVPAPAIAVVKLVSGITDNNGNGFTDAGDTINYAFTVANTGNVQLNNVTIADPAAIVSGGPLASLAAGATDTTTFTATHVLTAADVAAGQFQNQAVASGTDAGGAVVADDSDDAVLTENDPTVVTIAAVPGIALVKTVASVTDINGNTVTDAGDVIHYAFAVTNTGNVPLSNVTVTDPLVTVSGGPIAVLASGQTDAATFTAAYTITQADVNAGQVINQATANGTPPAGSAVTDLSDDAVVGEDDPTVTPIGAVGSIALVKKVAKVVDKNGDGITDAGDIIRYRFTVTNTGNVTLTNITVTDPLVTVQGGPLATLAPGQSDSTTFTAVYTITAADATAGKVVNQATASGSTPGGTAVSDRSDDAGISGDNPTVTPVAKRKPKLAKTALVSEIHRGEKAPFEITATGVTFNPARIVDVMPPGFTFVGGSATANGAPVKPKIDGRRLVFDGLTPDAKGTIKLKLSLLAGADVPTGAVINNAELYSPNGSGARVVAQANAAVTIVEEATFDCGDVIGRVFDDVNQDGYFNDGETGLAGVRLATVNGLLVTTDKQGRFHIACAAIPNADIGSNFVLKLDTRTLPTGYSLTSENPRDVRLTRGKVTKLNFGASLRRLVRVELRNEAFVAGDTALKPRWIGDMKSLLNALQAGPSILNLTYRYGAEGKKLAQARVAAIKALILAEWQHRKGPYRLTIDAKIAGAE